MSLLRRIMRQISNSMDLARRTRLRLPRLPRSTPTGPNTIPNDETNLQETKEVDTMVQKPLESPYLRARDRARLRLKTLSSDRRFIRAIASVLPLQRFSWNNTVCIVHDGSSAFL